jgi:phenylpropionate dioxygenase-like ring-hydroxylating dioxygenase large terminal subunit
MSRDQLIEMARRGLAHWRAGTVDLEPDVFRVPTTNYTDPERFQVELTQVFKRLPLMLAFTAELQTPGSYRAMEVAGVPVLLVRGADGAMRSFVNMCSHRGAQVAPDGLGEARRFTCPYHAWSYDTNGDLVGVLDANVFGDIDRSCLGLTPLPVCERAGLIWVVLTPGKAVDFDAFLCGYDELLSYHHFDRCRVVGRQTLVGPNWKVAYDGYLDYYHLPILHRNSFGPDMSTKALYDAWGPHQRVSAPDRTFGTKLDGKTEDEWTDADLTSGVWTIFPHVSIASFDNGVVYMVSQLFPGRNVGESVTIQNFLSTDREPAEGEEAFIAERMAFNLRVVRDEDYFTGLRIQRNVETGAKAEFIFGRNEGGGHRFHTWVQRLLDTDDADLPELFRSHAGRPAST